MFLLKRALLIAALAIAVSLSGCGLLPKEEEILAPPAVKPQKQSYHTAKVTRGSIEETVSGVGIFVTTKEYPIHFSAGETRLQQVLVEAGECVKKGQTLVISDTGDLDTQLKLEKYNLELKQLDVKQVNAGTDAIKKQQAQINLNIEKIRYDSLKKQLDDSVLVSPINGQVLSISSLKAGSVVSADQTILTVGDTSKLMISLDSTNAGKLKVGMKADLDLNGKALTGTLASLPAANEGTQKDVKIQLDQPVAGIKLGDLVQVKFVVSHKDHVLTVPLRAVQNFSGYYSVYVWDGTSKKEYPVNTGIKSDSDVEILSGLREGQNVIVS